MNDPSWTISDYAASELIVLAQAGVMTEETYMELKALPLNVKTTKQWPSQGGLPNLPLSAETLAQS